MIIEALSDGRRGRPGVQIIEHFPQAEIVKRAFAQFVEHMDRPRQASVLFHPGINQSDQVGTGDLLDQKFQQGAFGLQGDDRALQSGFAGRGPRFLFKFDDIRPDREILTQGVLADQPTELMIDAVEGVQQITLEVRADRRGEARRGLNKHGVT